jgi:hypothetical protein
VALLGFLLIVALYFVPMIIALIRGHHNALAISLLNFFLGWTFIGWVGALVWACTSPQPTTPVVVNQTVRPMQLDSASEAPAVAAPRYDTTTGRQILGYDATTGLPILGDAPEPQVSPPPADL